MLRQKQILEIPALLKAGWSLEKIATKLGVSYATVSRWRRKLKAAGHEIPEIKGGARKIEL